MTLPAWLRSFTRSWRSLSVASVAGVLLLGLGMAPSAPLPHDDDPAATVGMTNMLKYTPDTVRVSVGETVRWENSSIITHTVTADPAEATVDGSVQLPDGADPFDSGTMDPDETFEHTFETPGTYQYFCIPHEGAKMYGWVIVEP